MSLERDKSARPDTPAPVVQRAAADVAVPAAPVPLPAAAEAAPIGSLFVGHAEDRAEADADQMADVALSRLRRLEVGAGAVAAPEAHQHGPGCDHLRRSPAPSASPVVGYEGGALDSGTSSAIESRRGAGKPLDAEVRRRMEGAFGSSFSGVRIHNDDASAKLNTAVSARAFTTGKDVFFGKGQYAPGTPSGDKVLAHELAHTLQPSGGAHRLVAARSQAAVTRGVAVSDQIRRVNWKFWKKTPEEEKAAAQKKTDAATTKANTPYAGPSGAIPSATKEGVKGGLGLGLVAGATVAGLATGMGATSGLTGEMSGALTGGDSGIMGSMSGSTLRDEGQEFGDQGATALGVRKGKSQGIAGGLGLAGVAKAGVETGFVVSAAGGNATAKMGMQAALEAGKTAGDVGLRTAAGGLGIATGAISTLQGLWKGYKAGKKIWALSKGKGRDMLSTAGETWKAMILKAQKYKLAIAAAKTTLGVLGIAAGVLVLASNPIGWGIGLAAALIGGGMAIAKIVGKVKDAKKRAKISEDLKANKPLEDALVPEIPKKDLPGAAEPTVRQKTRKEAIQHANTVAREASDIGDLAGRLRAALTAGGDYNLVPAAVELSDHGVPVKESLATGPQQEMHDSFMLLSSIGVDAPVALSDSGQELIEKKISLVEAL
ncbi:DUF4157 domain-containing protein [Nocardioides sp. W7]|uniref:eCIS core domain-containing protein n=1 Tax=Nocardioides sp. W7 TaxID=2931390 RepID=UPI001FD2FE01|nr:DUF4157 domain-containing protein [Nocardioides sp. W7]